MSIISNAKEIADLVKKIGDIELYRKIVELEGEIMDLTRQKREFEEKCRDLTEKLSFQAKLTFRPPLYYAEGDSVAFCPQCWESSRVAVHLQGPDGTSYKGHIAWRCMNCKREFSVRHGYD